MLKLLLEVWRLIFIRRKMTENKRLAQEKQKLFDLNLPAYYEKDGWLVREYPNGLVQKIKQTFK